MSPPAAEAPLAPESFRDKLPFPFGSGSWWVDGTTKVAFTKEHDPQLWRNAVIDEFDDHEFDWQVITVAALGFFTDSYALSATNVILPSLGYIYWPDVTDGSPELTINCVTLAGSVIGQLLFGWAADKWGRRKLYGLELALVIFGTLGMAQASSGIENNMNILRWITFYRFVLGVGIGAEYPLSAVITAEFADTRYRAQMMAAVFLMQPFGQILAAGVGWGVLENIVKKRHLDNLPAHGADLRDDQKKAILSAIDSIWRWVIGAGCIPAALAIFWRFAIPESPRYTMDVDDNATQAYYDVRRYGKKKDNEETTKRVRRGQRPDGGRKSNTSDASGNSHSTPAGGITEGTRRRRLSIGPRHPPIDISGGQSSSAYVGKSRGPLTDTTTDMSGGESSSTPANNTIGGHATEVGKPVATELNDITFCDHFCRDGNWKYLFATSSCWFFLDFAFYALGINNPRQISAIWDDYLPLPEKNDTSYAWPTTLLIGINNPTFSNATAADWQNPFDPGTNIYQELYHSAKQYILTISCGSLMGSILLLSIITKIPRKKWLVGSFVILALLFAILGGFYSAVAFKPHSHWATVLFYIACQFFFNLGPNTLTFIISAEIFPTKFRARCHGISAACGKIGAICVQLILCIPRFKKDPTSLGIILGVFSIPMALGALFAWIWIPDLQTDPDPTGKVEALHWATLPNKDLETLARGWKYANSKVAETDPRTGLIVLAEDQKLGFQKISNLYNRLYIRFVRGGFDNKGKNVSTDQEGQGGDSEYAMNQLTA